MAEIWGEIQGSFGNPAAAVGLVAAVVVGVVSSLHCFLMCGPLACAAMGGPRDRRGRRKAIAAYQLGRVGSYTVVGLLLGAVGGGVSHLLSFSIQPVLPWVMAATLVAAAFDVGKRLPALPGLRRVSGWVARKSAGFSPTARSGAIGALTPLIPCGLLYGIFAAAVAAGTPLGGAAVMFGFAFGSGPALLLAQVQTQLWAKLPKGLAVGLQKGVPLFAAALLIYRAVMVSPETPACH